MYHDANSDIDEPEGEWSISQASLLLSQFLCGSGLSSPVLWWLEGSGQNAGSSPVGSSPGPGSTTHESQEGDGSAGFLISPFALWVSAGICNNGYLYVLLRHPFTPPTAIASSPATPHAELCTRACALTHSGMQARAKDSLRRSASTGRRLEDTVPLDKVYPHNVCALPKPLFMSVSSSNMNIGVPKSMERRLFSLSVDRAGSA